MQQLNSTYSVYDAVYCVDNGNNRIRFEYNGQTSTLQSSSEIAAWIAERKKRFPTKARAAEAAERKKQNEETRRLARQAAKESQEKRRAEAREEQEQRKADSKDKQDKQSDAAKPRRSRGVKLEETETAQEKSDKKDAAALKARLRVEKLRRRLEKEEKRVAKAEAKASRSNAGGSMPKGSSELDQSPNKKKRKRTDSLGSSDSRDRNLRHTMSNRTATESIQHLDSSALQTNVENPVPEESKIAINTTDPPLSTSKQAPDTAQNPLTPTSQPSVPDIDQPAPPLTLTDDHHPAAAAPEDTALPKNPNVEGSNDPDNDSSDLSLSESSSDLSSDSDSDSDDSTSSSGSSSSSESDAAPESHPIKDQNPPRVPAPRRIKAKTSNRDICRQFLKNGRCPRGEKCHYRHELPEKGNLSKVERKAARESKGAGGKKERRKGLYQRVSG